MRVKIKFIAIIAMCFLFSTKEIKAQMAEVGFSIGMSTYQGDISPLGWRISFEGAHVARGVFLSLGLNDFTSVKIRYYSGFLSATDENAISDFRTGRNLHFKSTLKEISIVGEIKLLSLIPAFRKFKIQPYFNVGIGVFRYNPQAKYRGIWYDLQPLGTEGQGLEGSTQEKYGLTQFTIPLGFGLSYKVNEEMVIGIEISPRWTFTDYLDDVSTTYPDLALLAQERGDLAVNLSYRGEEIPVDASELTNIGRGNSNENDWYIISTISVAYRFDPGVYMDRRKGFQGYWKCPYN